LVQPAQAHLIIHGVNLDLLSVRIWTYIRTQLTLDPFTFRVKQRRPTLMAICRADADAASAVSIS